MKYLDTNTPGATAERFAALSRVGAALLNEMDESRLLHLIAETACDLTGAAFAAFSLRPVNEEGEPLVPSEGSLFHLAAIVGVPRRRKCSYVVCHLGEKDSSPRSFTMEYRCVSLMLSPSLVIWRESRLLATVTWPGRWHLPMLRDNCSRRSYAPWASHEVIPSCVVSWELRCLIMLDRCGEDCSWAIPSPINSPRMMNYSW